MKNICMAAAAVLVLGAALPVRAGSLDLDFVTLAIDSAQDQCRVTASGNPPLTLASPSGKLDFVDVDGQTPPRDMKTWKNFKNALGDGHFLHLHIDYGGDPGKPSYVRVTLHD